MVKVSVIIPVYNAKDFLHESINSVLNQTLKDIELICVNDGSTDNSLEILNEFAKKDSRVRVFDKENGGCGSARNIALDNASGDYIYFFDPDDFISEDAFEKLYNNALNNDSDLVIFKIARFEDVDNIDYSHPGFNLDELFGDVDFNDFSFNYSDIKEHVLNTSFAPWTKLYKSEMLNRYDDFRFPTDIAFDDTPFHVQSMLRAEKISFVPEFFYFYRFNPNSVNNTSSNGMDIFRICDIVEGFLKDNNYYDEFVEEFKYFKIKQIFNYISSTGTEEYFRLAKDELLAIDIDDNNIIPEYLMKEYNMIINSDSFKEYDLRKNNKNSDDSDGKIKKALKSVDVSVIIPVYNTEQYLEECLNSIVNQTLRNIEIICIDDGSTDNSLEILKKYEKTDSRFKIVSQKNSGQGSARNKGMSLASGKYIYFMDSDDFIELNTLKDTFEIAEKNNLDLVMFQLINYDEDTGELFKNDYYTMEEIYDCVGEEVFSVHDVDELIFDIAVSPVNKLYNREFILSTGAKFPKDLIFEDNLFFFDFIFDVKRMAFHKEFLYTRRVHTASATGLGDKRFLDTIKVNNLIIDKFIKKGLFEKYREILYNKKINLISVRYMNIQEQYKEYFYNEILKEFKLMIDHENYEDFLYCLTPRHKKFFDDAIYSENFKEFNLLAGNLFLKEDNGRKMIAINKYNKEIENHNKRKNQIILSKSWTITKPLRWVKKD